MSDTLTDAQISALGDYPLSYWKRFSVTQDDLDGFNHVNNAVYLKWIDETIWEHTAQVGLDAQACLNLNRGMAAVRHEIDYLASAFLGDDLVVYTWVATNDFRLRSSRLLQIVRLSDQKTILRAKSDYVCTNMTTGRPARMPDIFRELYPVTVPRDAI